MNIIKPPHLKCGDIVGIVSPSSHIVNFPRRLERGIATIESMGLKVKLGKNSQKKLRGDAGTSAERVSDIHEFFADSNMKAIICSTGGFGANALLDDLDYDLIRSNPKIFCGYSDITILNLAIFHKSHLVTFSGPTILPVFGEYGAPEEFILRNFKKAVFKPEPIGVIESSDRFSDETLIWEKEDNRNRIYKLAEPVKTICAGKANGILMGGNLNSICCLTGTEYLPDFQEAILFLEDNSNSIAMIERSFHHLEQVGVFRNIKGLMYGRTWNFQSGTVGADLYKILGYFGSKYHIPVIANMDIGHTFPMVTLPIGVKVELNADDAQLKIIESATI